MDTCSLLEKNMIIIMQGWFFFQTMFELSLWKYCTGVILLVKSLLNIGQPSLLPVSQHNFTDNKSGFISNHCTDMCIYALKEIVNQYRGKSLTVFSCFIDVS